MFKEMADYLQRHMLSCPSKRLLSIDCPGCGMQRSFVALLRGELVESLRLHPATIPLLALLLFTLLHLLFSFRNGWRVIIALQLTVAVLSFGLFVTKLAVRFS